MKTSPEQVAEALRVSLKEAERLRQRNRRLQEAAAEPIALVGMSCRYPGGVDSPEQLWELLAAAGDAIGAFPTDRDWDLDALQEPDLGISYLREGGFLQRATEFDNEFFGINPREALGMDAQERLLLEAAWEALEDAGLVPDSLRGSRTGVFAGTMYHDYGWGLSPFEESAANLATGGTSSIVAGRISYTLGLEGPAISIDTACSSSLVALHLATQALRGGECELALAGGATVYSTPGVFVQFGRQRALSPDGRCKAFAEGADGAGFSEGVGMVLLERLSDARRNGHPILATIRGSAVNQDGASNGITSPNGPAQERAIRQALENARLTAGEVDAVEAHGTGTPLGDPIEAGALLATYGSARSSGDPLLLGSIKSNIGHPQAAAGVAGVIKMALALRKGLLPKTLHSDRPSSKIDWSAGHVELLTEARPWPRGERPRRAGISSFGATGTNAHLILEEAPQPEPGADADNGHDPGGASATAPPLPGVLLLPLSAKSEPALREQATRLASHLESHPDVEALDAAYSMATARTAFERRATIVGSDRESLLAGLGALGGEGDGVALARGRAAPGKVAYVFAGHGGQWRGMGVGLLDASPAFASHFAACEEALAPYVDWSLSDVLRDPSDDRIDRLEVLQPALFALMVSLAKLWRECGVEPAVVIGHSQGEVAAAHVAGGLSLQDGMLISTVRGRLLETLFGSGALASIFLSREELEARLLDWEGRIEVAALNGPGSAIVSGETEALGELLEQCEAEGVGTRRLPTSMASHSKQVEVLRDELLEALAPLSPRSGEIPFHSTVTGEVLDIAELSAEYWYRNTRQTVLLEPVVRGLVGKGCRTFVEIAPHPILAVGLQETVEAVPEGRDSVAVVPTLRRGEGGPERFALSLAQAQASGARVDWDAIFAGADPKRVSLPTYPFQRRRFWLGGGVGRADLEQAGMESTDHPLLGAAVTVADGEALLLAGRLSLESHPWLADHVYETVLLPGTAFVELALKAGDEVGCETLEDLALGAPLLLPEQGSVAIQVLVAAPSEDGRRELSIHSRPDSEEGGEWTRNATGILSPAPLAPPRAPAAWPPPGAQPLQLDGMYERLADRGLIYGPAFQCVDAAWSRGEELFVEMSLAAEQGEEASRFGLHPALLDASSHVGFDRMVAADDGEPGALALPFAWRGIRYFAAAGPGSMRVRVAPSGEGHTFEAFDAGGAPVALVESVITRPAEPGSIAAATERLPIYRLEWTAAEALKTEAAPSLAVLGTEPPAGLAAEGFADLAALEKAIEAGRVAPDTALVDGRVEADDPIAGAHTASQRALDLVKTWAAAQSLGQARLVFLTEGAVTAEPGERPDLATAPIWGLVRSAHSEHPGRFGLLDVDGEHGSWEAVPSALALFEEPQVAIRRGEVRVPRLARAAFEPTSSERLDPESTVLVTGGTSGIGARVARHLVAEWGARQLLLVSRSGEAAAGATELREELQGLGATVRIAACDVSDRDSLAGLLDSIPESSPLGMVVHSAAVIADGVLESQDDERLERVMRPKADAAWHLHELTQGMPVSRFILFSSAAGLLGGAGQVNYAAANAFLDALVQHRAAIGLPATALAWGLWQQETRLMGFADRAEGEAAGRRIRERFAVAPMSPARGLELFDRAADCKEPLLMPAELDPGVMRAQARSGALPAILRGLVRLPRRRGRGDDSLAGRLAAADEQDRPRICLELVRDHAAAVVGLASAAEIDPELSFRDLGFDSLGAVELRNRLVVATGLRLPATLAFDHPSPGATAKFVLDELLGEGGIAAAPTSTRSFAGEPIAIVGMACRYPGGIASPADLWKLLESGGDAIAPLPTDRGWDLERLYDPDPESQDTFYIREAGLLPDAAEFDAAFFNISPREAVTLDPQERLLLEACWEALEDGGIDPTSLRGSSTGVFSGVMYQDYGRAAGMSSSRVSGRVAYTFGLEGPTMSVDTACSSSLVSLHLAAQALRQGECSLALAGGVTVASTPGMLIYFSSQRGLALDGRCKAFAEGADGTGVSEGVGVLVLERLSDAEANGHQVLATIKGSALNQDGASNGLTAPNGPSQERVIHAALANAGIGPEDVDAVEAHGTGTALGDPIEAGALLATYGAERERPLWLGSVKSNIGHAQAAAGVASAIKMVMALREGVLPRTLHAERPSSRIDWSSGAIELLAEATPWEPNGSPRRAGVSSFGASGTNAHLILEEAPPQQEGGQAASEGAPSPTEGLPLSGVLTFSVSAKSETALREAARRLVAHLRGNPGLGLPDVAYSLAATRANFEWRAVALASTREQLLDVLAVLAAGESAPDAVLGRARSGPLAFLFSGQGSQRPGMGRELYETSRVYREALDEACALLDPELDRPLRDLLFADPGSADAALLDRTTYAQPALFATGVALQQLLGACGLRPELLAGHSIGEIVAAHVAGALSLADAAKLVAARGRLMGELPEGGAMVAIEAGEDEVAAELDGRESEVSIAAVNGPRAVVVSGRSEAAEEIASRFADRGAKTKRLAVSHAFHSPLIEPMLEDFARVAQSLDFEEPKIPIVSGLSGQLLDPAAATDPGYWVEHAREPVRFADAVEAIVARGASVCVELGPDPVLLAMAETCLADADGAPALVPTLREGRAEPHALAATVAAAQVAGAKVDRRAFFAAAPVKRVPLPTYPFERKRYWEEGAAASPDVRAAGQTPTSHPLLGARIEHPAGQGLTLTGSVSLASHPWLADHAVAGSVLLPGAAFLDLALVAAREVGWETVAELVLHEPLVLQETGALRLQVSVGADEEGRRQIAIHSSPAAAEDGDWALHAQGLLSEEAAEQPQTLGAWPPAGAESLDPDDLYASLAAAGIEYGPAFRGLSAAWRLVDEVYAEVAAPEAQAAERFALHPVLLDSAGHAAIGSVLAEADDALVLPFAWTGVSLRSAGAARLRVRIDGEALVAFDEAGAPVLSVRSLSTRSLDVDRLATGARRRFMHELRWRPAPRAAKEPGEVATWRWQSKGEGAAAASAALGAIQAHLAEDRAEPLAILTEGAVRAREGETPKPAAAAIWGLVRSAQAEHPERFLLIDGEGDPPLQEALALAREGESQLALREGELLVPRLERFEAGTETPPHLDPQRTVLVTGASGGLGALVTRHLVREHGARHLMLIGRSGTASPTAAGLQAELAELGAEARFVAVDVGDRAALEETLAAASADRPIGAVFHCAGQLDDGVIDSLDAERIERAFRPKADGARHLDELLREAPLSHFVVFSSAAGMLGSPGQGNYAAANAYCDALAQRRRAEGLPATSLAWGPWSVGGGMGEGLDAADRARLARMGFLALSVEEGLDLLDAALAVEAPSLAPIAFEPRALRARAKAGALAPPLRGLVRAPAGNAATGPSLSARLGAAAAADRVAVATDFVRENVAAVLGHSGAAEIESQRAFSELGFDSLAAVELRNRLSAGAGLRLPPTLVFDYPTAEAVAGHLLGELDPESSGDPAEAREREIEQVLLQLEQALAGVDGDERLRVLLDGRLRSLLAALSDRAADEPALDEEGLGSMSHDEVFELIDQELGAS
jgi:acyl transferase domain-containing protein/acyl carrier protein